MNSLVRVRLFSTGKYTYININLIAKIDYDYNSNMYTVYFNDLYRNQVPLDISRYSGNKLLKIMEIKE